MKLFLARSPTWSHLCEIQCTTFIPLSGFLVTFDTSDHLLSLEASLDILGSLRVASFSRRWSTLWRFKALSDYVVPIGALFSSKRVSCHLQAEDNQISLESGLFSWAPSPDTPFTRQTLWLEKPRDVCGILDASLIDLGQVMTLLSMFLNPQKRVGGE